MTDSQLDTVQQAIYDALHRSGFDYGEAAQAAIDALGLTKEMGLTPSLHSVRWRWVSPWEVQEDTPWEKKHG